LGDKPGNNQLPGVLELLLFGYKKKMPEMAVKNYKEQSIINFTNAPWMDTRF
jgi:hypothetical protein